MRLSNTEQAHIAGTSIAMSATHDSVTLTWVRPRRRHASPATWSWTASQFHVVRVPASPSDVTVELWSANSDSTPDTSVATLTHSTGTWATDANTFNAPTDTELDASTLYFVHVSYSGTGSELALDVTSSSAHDSGEAAGWSVGRRYERTDGSWSSGNRRLRFKIIGAETIAETTLVSNIGQAEATLSRNPVGQPIGMQFTTGDNAAGYNLDSVEIAVGDYENVVVTVSLYSDSSGEPGSSIFNFTNPTSGITADAVNTFTAPANTTLAGSNTPYFIVFDGANDPDESTNRVRIFMTYTNDEDSGGATNAEGDADWEIADISHALDSGVWYGDDTDELKIRLKGSAKSGGDTPTVSTDATLSALSLGTGVTLSPAFDADTYAYTASVANSVDEVTVTASTTDTDATFEYLDESDATLDDEDTNAAGHQVELDVGDTVFKVKVTAEDGTTTQNYTVTVTRAACTLNDGDLWCGVVDVGTITNSGGMTQSHGFQGTKGDLSDKTFSLMFETGTTNNYTITAIVVGARTAISEQLFFVTSNTLTNTEEESLALHVDGESDPFVWSDSTEVIPGSYRWPARTDLDWSSETTVTLRLREFLRPTVTNVAVTSMPVLETDTYGAGETIEVSVTFSEAVDATSNTDFVLSVGGARRAPLLSGSGTATLVFGYTVVSSDEDTNGIWIGDETRTLVGNRNGEPQNGTITSVATGAAAVIAHTLLGTDSDHKVDGSRSDVAPTLSIGNASGTEGGAVTFTVTLSAAAAADVTATWTASIGTGDTAVAGDLGTKTGTAFVAMGVTTGTFDVPTAEDSTEEADETFTVTLSGVSSNAQLAADPTAKGTIIDDDTAPTVTNVEVTSTPVLESDTYGAGETIEVSVTFSEAVDATSDTDFVLSVAGGKRAPLVSGSGTATLVFGYTVADDDADDNGIWIGDETGTLVGNRGGEPQNGAITSVANAAAADIDHAELGTQSGHKVDGTRSIVSVEVTSDPSLEMDTYGAGETIQFTVTFNVPVDVDGDPVLEFLFDGSEVRQAGDVSGSGTTELVFGYTVVSGDDDDNGLYIRDESDYNNPDGPVRLDSNDAIEFKDTSTDVPLYWQGRGTQSGHKVDGSRTTGNNPPSFTTSATLSIQENTGRLTVVAEDSDTDDDITGYAITGGADNSHFSSVSSSGELQFVNDPNFENPQDSGTDNTYEVTVQATSGTGTREMTATRTFTVTVTDVAEQSAKPDKPTLAAVSGSSTSLTATWEAPDKNGGPAITGYDLQYKESTESSWEDFAHTGTAVTTTITGLTADTSYEARVLAKNGETDSDWSDASDAVSTNAAAVLPTLSVANVAGTEGTALSFTVTLSAESGETVTVDYATSVQTGDTATSGTDFTAKTSTTLTFEPGDTTKTFTVQTTDDTDIEGDETFTVTLSNPSNAAISDATAKGTINDDDEANAAPSFSSSATFDADENQTVAGTVLATDSDSGDDITGYAITGGADQDFFSIGATSGALTFDAAPNFEDPKDHDTNNIYVVTVTATSGMGTRVKTATQTITVTVTDVSGEAPGKPAKPRVSAASVTSLRVNWSAPSNAGPAITDYDVQYRAGTSGAWSTKSHSGTATATTLTELTEDTPYQVQVRAKNAEGTGAWSDSGSGTPAEEDDLPADTTTTGEVEVGEAAVRGDILAPVEETVTWTIINTEGDEEEQTGTVYDFDTDWFAVELEEGRTYRIDMEGAIHADDDDLTLRLPQINAIYNEDGEFLVNTFDSDESDSHYLFRVTFHAHDDGTYYIAASGESHEWGTYELRVKDIKDITEDDDEHTAAQRGLKNLRAVEEKVGVRLTWQPPDGAAVTGYRIERRRAGGQDSGPQRSHGQPRDHHTLVEDTGNTETSYVDESAEQGVEYEYRVTARNESGPGEESDWVRAGPASASNNPATGAPTISGTTQVGETLTADISGIADADGLSGETFTYQWVSSDGTTDTDIENANGSTYTLIAADQGKSVKVSVTFTDDGGNEETLTSTPTEPVLGDGPPGAPRNLTATPGNREVSLSWDPPDDNGNAPATRYRIEWRVDGKDYDKNHWGTARSTTYTTNDQANLANGVKYFFRVKAGNGSGYSYGPYGPSSGEVSATPTSGSAVDLDTPVLSDTETLHHGMVQLDWQDIEDAGWYVVQYYHLEDEEWLDLPAEGVDIAFHGSSAVVSNLHGLHWLRVGAASCAGSSEWSQIEELYGTNASDWEGVPVPEVEEGDETEPCPVVLGTPVLSDTEILHHGMVQLDWQDIEDAGWYVVQYYHLEDEEWLDLPAEGVDIAFHGSSAVVSNLHGLSWLRVGAASCDGASEWSQIEESYGTNASDWKGVPVPEVAEGDEIEPCSEDADTPDNSPATGAPTISGTAQVGETLTANTSGVADGDGLSNVQYEYQWLADDADISGATNATYTLVAADEGKAVKVQVSFTDDEGNEETLTSTATDAVAGAQPTEPPDKPTGLEATASHDSVTLTWDDPGDDSITGYVILRRVRVNNTGGEFSELVADTGTAATTYTDDTVAAGTTYTYRIKAINGAGTSERSRWFHIDTPAAPVPDKPTGLSATASHDAITLTWDDPGDDSITGYVILRRLRYDDPSGHFDELVADTGTAATTYTDDTVKANTSYTYRIKAINEHGGVSERSRWFHIQTPAAP